MESLFLLSLFLYLASAFLAWGAIRPESRRSLMAAVTVYGAAAAVTAGLGAWRWLKPGALPGSDFILWAMGAQGLLAALFFSLRGRVASPVFLTATSGLSLWLGLAAFARGGFASGEDADSALSAAHAFMMFASFAALSLSFVFASLYSAQEKLLKQKASSRWLDILPPLELSGRFSFWSLAWGTALFAAGAAAGGVLAVREANWAVVAGDPVIWLSFFLLAVYGALIGARLAPLERLRTAVWLSIICYGVWAAVFLAAHRFGGAR